MRVSFSVDCVFGTVIALVEEGSHLAHFEQIGGRVGMPKARSKTFEM